MKKSSRIQLIDEEEEEFEPLFDYRRIQPFSNVEVGEDSLDRPHVVSKKQKIEATAAVNKNDKKADDCVILKCDDSEEEDWLPPAPVVTNDTSVIGEDSVRRQLRLKREELLSSVRSAEEYIRNIEEETKHGFADVELSDDESDTPPPKTSKPSDARPKIVITLQDKNGPMKSRFYMDDAFEKIFQMYAQKVKIDLKNLSFTFDGDKISPDATPSSLGMEEEDIIEVNVKSK